MGKKYKIIILISVIVGVSSIVAGFLISGLDSFVENLLAELGGLTFALALALWLIEGHSLTQEQRVQEVISVVTRRTLKLNEEIAMMLSREIGQYLVSSLDLPIDLYGDERGNWIDFKPLLQQVFEYAKQVNMKGLLEKNVSLDIDEYRIFLNSARIYIESINRTTGSDWTIIAKAGLLELVDSVEKLQLVSSSSARDEESRFRQLGTIGDKLIISIEVGSRIVV